MIMHSIGTPKFMTVKVIHQVRLECVRIDIITLVEESDLFIFELTLVNSFDCHLLTR